jgi:serine/threonine protein kinase
MYSKELAGLIDLLLQKDPNKRPSVREILKMDLIRKKAQEFVESQMNTNSVQRSKTMVFVKNIPKVVVKPDESHLTPKERMQLKK